MGIYYRYSRPSDKVDSPRSLCFYNRRKDIRSMKTEDVEHLFRLKMIPTYLQVGWMDAVKTSTKPEDTLRNWRERICKFAKLSAVSGFLSAMSALPVFIYGLSIINIFLALCSIFAALASGLAYVDILVLRKRIGTHVFVSDFSALVAQFGSCYELLKYANHEQLRGAATDKLVQMIVDHRKDFATYPFSEKWLNNGSRIVNSFSVFSKFSLFGYKDRHELVKKADELEKKISRDIEPEFRMTSDTGILAGE